MHQTEITPLPFHASLDQYEKQAAMLFEACQAGDDELIQFIKSNHPRLRKLSGPASKTATITSADTQLITANFYQFGSWPKLIAYTQAVLSENSPVSQFEQAIEAIITGDIAVLTSLLQKNTGLISMRSMRTHHAMLIHYIGANGIEGYRQKSPANAVEVLKLLLAAGAETDAVSGMYGKDTTLGLVATSIWPAKTGVLVPLLETLLEAGADVEGAPGGWKPLNAALHNGRPEGAAILARHGAHLDLEGAAGVGRLDVVKTFFTKNGRLKAIATKEQMEAGLMWACEYGHTAVVEFLLDHDLDPGVLVNGMTGLHWAVIGGHLDTIKLLINRKAPLEKMNAYGGTVLNGTLWATIHSDPVYRWPDTQTDYALIIKTLVDAGAVIEPGMLTWLAQQDSLSSSLKTNIEEVLRKGGAES